MKPQFDLSNGIFLPKVTIKGKYYGDKTFPSLNNYLAAVGRNPKAGGRMKSDYMMICNNAIRTQLKRYKATNPIVLHYIYYEPKKGQKRDFMNCHFLFAKFFEDSLQVCGVIENDNPKWLLNETHDFYYADDPYIEVYIEEIEDEM
jgi:hypothetical protein